MHILLRTDLTTIESTFFIKISKSALGRIVTGITDDVDLQFLIATPMLCLGYGWGNVTVSVGHARTPPRTSCPPSSQPIHNLVR